MAPVMKMPAMISTRTKIVMANSAAAWPAWPWAGPAARRVNGFQQRMTLLPGLGRAAIEILPPGEGAAKQLQVNVKDGQVPLELPGRSYDHRPPRVIYGHLRVRSVNTEGVEDG